MKLNTIYNEDCLEGMKRIPDGSVDMILCDLPYGTTAISWDSVIPLEPLWSQYRRIIKENGAIVLFGREPFSSSMRMFAKDIYKYDWKWEKPQGVNFAQAKYMPMSVYEDVMVFGSFGMSKNAKIQPTYNPQSLKEVNIKKKPKTSTEFRKTDKNPSHIQTHTGYPRQIIKFPTERGYHPTQKPVALFEYLIKTYTDKGETVLDATIGSGTTAIACLNTDRQYIGFELDEKYHKLSLDRIENHTQQLSLI